GFPRPFVFAPHDNNVMAFLEALNASPALLFATVGLAGLCVGSFLNVVIHRLPRMMEAQWRAECAALAGDEPAEAPAYNLVQPPSAGPRGATPVGAWQNVPVVSWLWLRGRCAACGTPISFRYPAVELAAAALGVALAWQYGYSAQLALSLVFAWALLAL